MTENEEQKVIAVSKSAKNSTRLINIGIFFTTFALVVFVSAFGYGYYELSKVNMSLANMMTDLQLQANENKKEVVSLQQALQEVQATAEKSKELSAKQEQLITEWKDSQKGNLEKWHVAEAQYLVTLANDHVVFTHNTLMALTLLQRADQALAGLNDNNLMPIRKSIAGDIATLLAAPQVDTTKLYLILSSINQQVMKLPLPAGPMQRFEEPSKEPAHDQSLSWWRMGLHNTWDALKKIVIVRYNGANSPPLVLPEEREFLYQNLRSQIETAIWAALHNDKQIYQSSLNQASAWVQQYFVMTAPETEAMLQRLDELKSLNVQPPIANLTPTLQLFDGYMKKAG